VKGACALLEVEDLVAGYEAGVPIVRGVALRADRGELVAILGPNGAGKSTLIKAIAGMVPLTSGRILVEGEDISAQPAHRRVHGGVAFVPQTENVFATLSVSDNLRIAAQLLAAAQRAARIAMVYEMFADLARQRSLAAGRLSGGQRQMLAVARALVVAPKLLLLDEPSAGLSPKAAAELFRKLSGIRQSGVGVVLVEQNVRAALAAADRAYVLVEGRNCREGSCSDLAADPQIGALYLGVRESLGAAPDAHGAATGPVS
jgi:branched-chain amino acid transport system ATP-binding protein